MLSPLFHLRSFFLLIKNKILTANDHQRPACAKIRSRCCHVRTYCSTVDRFIYIATRWGEIIKRCLYSLYHLKLSIYHPRHCLEDLACKGFNVLVYSMHIIRVQDVDYESVEECAGTLAPLKFVMPHDPPPPPPMATCT